MIRTIDGKRYLMRDTRPTRELRALWRAYCAKFKPITFERWLAERGKVHLCIDRR